MCDLIEIFRQEIFQTLLESMFSIAELNSKKELSDKIKYCKNFLKIVGKGTTRISFYLPKMNHVLKLALMKLVSNKMNLNAIKRKLIIKFLQKFIGMLMILVG